MSFKIISNLIAKEDIPKPVIDSHRVGEVLVVSCKDFRGEISSITGIAGKFIYVARLVPGLSEVKCLPPTVHIVCTEECITKCKYL